MLVVDDSAFMRRVLIDLLQSDPGITVVGTARDGREGVEQCLALRPDVITLDIEMPRLDGFGALKQIMLQAPVPVVMVSSHTRAGAEATIKALALGAVDFVAKPSGSISLDMHKVREELVRRVRGAAGARPRSRGLLAELPAFNAGPKRVAAALDGERRPADRLVVIGCSTGGPGALHQLLPRLPSTLDAAVVVVQHMPRGFTRSLAGRLDEICALQVREAQDGDLLLAGVALVAPGGQHLEVIEGGRVRLTDDPPVNGVRPSVDCTLRSAAAVYRARTLGVILTGMGSDGTQGVADVKSAGGWAVAEHASTCVVYGMPKAVVDRGLADRVLPVHEIPGAIAGYARGDFERKGVGRS